MKSTCNCDYDPRRDIPVIPDLSRTPREIRALANAGVPVGSTEAIFPEGVPEVKPGDFSVPFEARGDVDVNMLWQRQQTARRKIAEIRRTSVVQDDKPAES